MIKEYCDRCETEIVKDLKYGISFECTQLVCGMSGKVDMVVCPSCQKDIKDFAEIK